MRTILSTSQKPPPLPLVHKMPEVNRYKERVTMARSKFGIIKEFWSFMKVRKKFWLAPLLMSMVLLGLLLVVAQGSAVAPFIYTLF